VTSEEHEGQLAGTASSPRKTGPMQTARNFVRQWFPLILWFSFIFWMSTGSFSSENTFSVVKGLFQFLLPNLSAREVRLIHVMTREAAHVFEYFILGLLLFRAFRVRDAGWKWRWCVFAVIGVVFWALGDEFHQSFVATRQSSLTDVGIDTVGGILSQIVSALWYRGV
jgi:VanZ family protein